MIPFNIPFVPADSKKYVLQALEGSNQNSDGEFTKRAAEILSKLVGGGHVLLTPSCTDALEMASMLVNLGPGDEVILPSYNFTSAAIAITKFGATPVFVDIDINSKCIDTDQVQAAITPKTKAISWVNYAGNSPKIDHLIELSKEFNLFLIEDNAHGLGGKYKGQPLGSFGDLATQSFHSTKNIQCGEGGALVINNSEFLDRAIIIRDKGTNRSKFIEGKVQKYQWVDHGSSYLLAESLAAILLGQLENYSLIQNMRKQIYEKYLAVPWKRGIIRDIGDNSAVYHMFSIEFMSENYLKKFEQGLKENGVTTATHYQPLHISHFGRKFVNNIAENSVSHKVSSTLIRMPFYPELLGADLDRIIHNIDQVLDAI
jgi:dTDP-4-amino-4,6-dideoxygalactose transaminase